VKKVDGLSGMTYTWAYAQLVDYVIVKAGDSSKVVDVNPPSTSGTVDSSGMPNNGGQQPEISHVQLCKNNRRRRWRVR
jgi:hypothetical protein